MRKVFILLLVAIISYAKTPNTLETEFKMLLEKRVKGFESAGGIIAINLDNSDYIYSYGCAKLSTKAMKNGIDYNKCEENMTSNHKFKIGSITKTVSANIILNLIAQKKLNFDTKVSEVLDLNMSNYDLNEITISELLTHTSGLFNLTNSKKWFKAYIYNPTKKFTINELFKMVDLEKGKDGFKYSNSNYLFLAKIIENITGKSWEYNVDKILTKALGKHNFIISDIQKDEFNIDNLANGYIQMDYYDSIYNTNFSSDDIIYDDRSKLHPSFIWATGNLITDIKGLNSWIKIIGEGKLYKKEFFNKNIKDTSKYIKTKYFKMGYGIGYDEDLNALFHLGSIDGYNCIIMYGFNSNSSISTCFNSKIINSKKPYPLKLLTEDILNLIEAK